MTNVSNNGISSFEPPPFELQRLPDSILTELFMRMEIFQLEALRLCTSHLKGLAEQNIVWEVVAYEIGIDLDAIHPRSEYDLPINTLRLRTIRYIVHLFKQRIVFPAAPAGPNVISARRNYSDKILRKKDVRAVSRWLWTERMIRPFPEASFKILIPRYTQHSELLNARELLKLRRVLSLAIKQPPPHLGEITTRQELVEASAAVSVWVRRKSFSLGKINRLNLSDKRLFSLPSFIEIFRSVTRLDLSRNFLQELPVAIEQMTLLRELEISNNYLTALTLNCSCFPNLRVLDISRNQLFTFPTSVCGLPHLEICRCTHNIITFIPPQLARCTSLKDLSLRHNILLSFPDEVANIPSLRLLNISNNCLRRRPVIEQANFLLKVTSDENFFNRTS